MNLDNLENSYKEYNKYNIELRQYNRDCKSINLDKNKKIIRKRIIKSKAISFNNSCRKRLKFFLNNIDIRLNHFYTITFNKRTSTKKRLEVFTDFVNMLKKNSIKYIWKKELGSNNDNLHFHILTNTKLILKKNKRYFIHYRFFKLDRIAKNYLIKKKIEILKTKKSVGRFWGSNIKLRFYVVCLNLEQFDKFKKEYIQLNLDKFSNYQINILMNSKNLIFWNFTFIPEF